MKKSIVCLLDILGYKKLVNKPHRSKEYIEQFNKVFNQSLSMIDGLKSNLYSKSSYNIEKKQKLIKDIRVLTFSDSIVFVLYIREKDNEHINNCLFIFLNLISTFSTLFIGRIGNTLRGGISIGQHYDNCDEYFKNKDTKFFMFSKSLVQSQELESKSSFYPRVLIDKKLENYFKKISFNNYEHYFFSDFFNQTCLRLYSHFLRFKNISDVRSELLLIKKQIEKSIDEHHGDRNTLEKLYYFSNYHNYECERLNIDDKCYIDLTLPY